MWVLFEDEIDQIMIQAKNENITNPLGYLCINYQLVLRNMFYCLSMCLNSERKEQFADVIYCISFLCNSSCGSWQLEIFLKLNDYWLIDWLID